MSKIKSFRNALNLSIYDIAEKSGLTPGYINNLENGHKLNPSKETMEKIAKALNKTVQEVFYPEN